MTDDSSSFESVNRLQASKNEVANHDLNLILCKVEKRVIQIKAYEIYLNRLNTNIPGDSVSDWLTAEDEIKNNLYIKGNNIGGQHAD